MKSSLLNYKTFTYTILVVLLIYVFYICFVSKKNILSNLNSHKEGFSSNSKAINKKEDTINLQNF